MRTPTWPARWNAAMRWSGMACPTWTCGAVTSMPSFTRNGRPRSSFRSSSPTGSTSTALRVRLERRSGAAMTAPDHKRLERIGSEAPRRGRVPDAEGEARRSEHRRDAGEGAHDGPRDERTPEAAGEQRHRDRREHGQQRKRRDGERGRLDRGDEQDPDAGAPAHAVDETDPERAEPAPRMAVAVADVDVRVVDVAVGVHVLVEGAAPPADEQADGEVHDHDGDRGLRCLLCPLRQVAVEEQDREPEREEREAVPQPPGEAELA